MSAVDVISQTKNNRTLHKKLSMLAKDIDSLPITQRLQVVEKLIRATERWVKVRPVWRIVGCFVTLGIYPLFHFIVALILHKVFTWRVEQLSFYEVEAVLQRIVASAIKNDLQNIQLSYDEQMGYTITFSGEDKIYLTMLLNNANLSHLILGTDLIDNLGDVLGHLLREQYTPTEDKSVPVLSKLRLMWLH